VLEIEEPDTESEGRDNPADDGLRPTATLGLLPITKKPRIGPRQLSQEGEGESTKAYCKCEWRVRGATKGAQQQKRNTASEMDGYRAGW